MRMRTGPLHVQTLVVSCGLTLFNVFCRILLLCPCQNVVSDIVITRIINLSSGLGNTKHLSQQWRDAVLNSDLTVEGLTNIMDQFVA